jgi:hypothetical protein
VYFSPLTGNRELVVKHDKAGIAPDRFTFCFGVESVPFAFDETFTYGASRLVFVTAGPHTTKISCQRPELLGSPWNIKNGRGGLGTDGTFT